MTASVRMKPVRMKPVRMKPVRMKPVRTKPARTKPTQISEEKEKLTRSQEEGQLVVPLHQRP